MAKLTHAVHLYVYIHILGIKKYVINLKQKVQSICKFVKSKININSTFFIIFFRKFERIFILIIFNIFSQSIKKKQKFFENSENLFI